MASEILFKRGIEVFPRLKAKGLPLKTIKNKKIKRVFLRPTLILFY